MEGLINSFGTLLIVILGIMPGIPGDRVHSWLIGKSWLEKDFEYIIRILGFSVTGFLGYSILSSWLNWPSPIHVLPSTYDGLGVTTDGLSEIGFGYLGHLAVSMVVGGFMGLLHRLVAKCFPSKYGRHRDSWDEFVKVCAQERWITVNLRDGTVYVSILEQADIEREPNFRDLILKEPAIWDEALQNYIATNMLYLYIRGDQIASVSSLTRDRDKRLTVIGEPIFRKENAHEQWKAETNATAKTG